MYALKVRCDRHEFDEFIKGKLAPDDAERFADCEWIPTKIEVDDLLGIEVVAVAVKNK